MGKRLDMMLFPNHKSKAFTLSYDDGVLQDKKLIEILNKYQVKCTFNLNYGVLGYKSIISGKNDKKLDISKFNKDEIKEIYKNHEVGGHGLYHSSLANVGTPLMMYEIIEEKAQLEKLIEKPLNVFAYPFGQYNDDVITILKMAGYKMARTVDSSYSFDIPKDFLVFNPTCHHNDKKLMDLAKQFIDKLAFVPALFYVWGHAYEFDYDDNYDVIENLVKYLAKYDDQIWFATNGEIINYINAY